VFDKQAMQSKDWFSHATSSSFVTMGQHGFGSRTDGNGEENRDTYSSR